MLRPKGGSECCGLRCRRAHCDYDCKAYKKHHFRMVEKPVEVLEAISSKSFVGARYSL